MTDVPTCGNCDRPSPDAVVCPACAIKLRQLLTALPADMAELEVTITRQAKSGGSAGKRGKGHELPLAFGWDAANLADSIRNTLTTWQRIATDDDPETAKVQMLPILIGPVCIYCDHSTCVVERWRRAHQPPITVAEHCAWLAERVDWLRHQPFADEAFDELLSMGPYLRQAIDSRSFRPIGPCPALVQVMTLVIAEAVDDAERLSDGIDVVVTERVCGADLRLYSGMALVRCRDCGAEHDAAARVESVLLMLRTQLGTATDIAAVLTEAGYKITPARIWKWASRKQLPTTLRPSPALHRLADVLDLLKAKESGRAIAVDTPREAVTCA